MSADAFAQALKEMAAEYRAGLPAKMDQLDRLWRESSEAGAPPEALEELRRALHTIAGSAKTFGCAALTDAARAAELGLEDACDRGAPLARPEFEPLLETVRASVPRPDAA